MWYYWLRTSNSWRWLKQADKYLCRFGYRWFPCPTGFIAGLDRVLLCYSVKKISFITNQMYRGYVKNVLYTYRSDRVSDCSFITCGMFFVDGGATGCLQHVNVSRNVICLGVNNTNKLLIWFEAYTDWRSGRQGWRRRIISWSSVYLVKERGNELGSDPDGQRQNLKY